MRDKEELQLDHVKLGLISFRRFNAGASSQVSLSVSPLRLPETSRQLAYRDPFINLEAHGYFFPGSPVFGFLPRIKPSLGVWTETNNGSLAEIVAIHAAFSHLESTE